MVKRLEVVIVGDASALARTFGQASASATGFGGKMESIGSKLTSVGKTMTRDITLPIVGAGVAMVKAALDGQASTAKLDAAFTAAGLSAKQYAGQIDVAEASGRKLGFENAATRETLAKLVVATGSATKATADLGVVMDIARFKHVDLAAAAQMVAMAMAGSQRAIKQLGISIAPVTLAQDALRRGSEDLTTVQGRADLATAKLADKQATAARVIQAVTDKVKGQAEAFAQTSAGGMAQFRAQLNNLEENLGRTLLPIFNRLLDYLSRAITWFGNLSGSTQKTILVLAGVAAVIGPLVGVIGSVVTAVGALSTALLFLAANPIVLVIAAVAALGAAIAAAVLFPEQFKAALERMGLSSEAAKTVIADLQQAFQDIKAVVEVVWPLIEAIVVNALNQIRAVFQLLDDLLHGRWTKLWGDLTNIIRTALTGWISIARAELNLVVTVFTAAFTRIVSAITSEAAKVLSAATALGRSVVNGVRNGLVGIATGLAERMGELVGIIRGYVDNALSAAGAVGRAILRGVVLGLTGIAADVLGRFQEIYGILRSAAGIAEGLAVSIGNRIVSGIMSGLGGLLGALKSYVENAISSALSSLNPFSPVEHGGELYIGAPIVQGAIDGVRKAQGRLTSALNDSVRAAVIAHSPVSLSMPQMAPMVAGGRMTASVATAMPQAGGALSVPRGPRTLVTGGVHYHYQQPPEDPRLWAWQVGYDLAAVGS